jgi:two-component system LytT family response regulator
MKAIIVDDEPKAIELIQGYLVHFPQVQVLATFRNGLKALNFLNDNPVDLLFLDINMPHLSGISLSKLVAGELKVIFITAHAEHATESYEVEAIDYLLKPVSFERFTKAVHKAMKTTMPLENKIQEQGVINLKSGSNVHRVLFADILYLEKAANYITYHFINKKIMVRQSAAEALEQLPAYFIQAHKSFIVNSRRVDFYNKEEVTINGIKIPIGNTHREAFIQVCQQGKL